MFVLRPGKTPHLLVISHAPLGSPFSNFQDESIAIARQNTDDGHRCLLACSLKV